MKTFKKIVLVTFMAVLLGNCKKQEVPPSTVVGQPVFSFSGDINGSSVSLQAGINNYYMYSSFTQDSVGRDSVVYSFIGNLQSTSNSNNSIQISINDYRVSLKNVSVASHIDSSFSQALYFYYKPETDTIGYKVTFTPKIYSGSAEAFTYYFGDGSSNTVATSVPVTHTYTAATAYTTSVTVLFSGCGAETISNPISITKVASPLMIDSIHYTYEDTSSLKAVALKAFIQSGTPPFTYQWSFGDGSSNDTTYSASDTNTVDHRYSSTGTFLVSLSAKDQSGKSATYNERIVDSALSVCLFDYHESSSSPVIVSSSNLFSGIAIVYTDASGKVYTSNNPLQPNTSTFYITSVSNYKNNVNNQLTKELTIKFNCMLYSYSGSPIPASGTAVIAVAYQ